jgi:hypothetical protein
MDFLIETGGGELLGLRLAWLAKVGQSGMYRGDYIRKIVDVNCVVRNVRSDDFGREAGQSGLKILVLVEQ